MKGGVGVSEDKRFGIGSLGIVLSIQLVLHVSFLGYTLAHLTFHHLYEGRNLGATLYENCHESGPVNSIPSIR